MPTLTTTSQITGLHNQLLDSERCIERALDRGSRREFVLWCKRRASLSGRIQNLLVTLIR